MCSNVSHCTASCIPMKTILKVNKNNKIPKISSSTYKTQQELIRRWDSKRELFTTTSCNTSKYNPQIFNTTQAVAPRVGVASLYQCGKPSRRDVFWQPLNIHMRPAAGHSMATCYCLYSRAAAVQQWLIKHTPSEAREYVSENRYTWLRLLCLTPPAEGFPWDDLRKILCGCQRMAKVRNDVEKLRKITTAWVGAQALPTDDRRTDDSI